MQIGTCRREKKRTDHLRETDRQGEARKRELLCGDISKCPILPFRKRRTGKHIRRQGVAVVDHFHFPLCEFREAGREGREFIEGDVHLQHESQKKWEWEKEI
jgi:hypothetical protein